jgi:hypothetical protein
MATSKRRSVDGAGAVMRSATSASSGCTSTCPSNSTKTGSRPASRPISSRMAAPSAESAAWKVYDTPLRSSRSRIDCERADHRSPTTRTATGPIGSDRRQSCSASVTVRWNASSGCRYGLITTRSARPRVIAAGAEVSSRVFVGDRSSARRACGCNERARPSNVSASGPLATSRKARRPPSFSSVSSSDGQLSVPVTRTS